MCRSAGEVAHSVPGAERAQLSHLLSVPRRLHRRREGYVHARTHTLHIHIRVHNGADGLIGPPATFNCTPRGHELDCVYMYANTYCAFSPLAKYKLKEASKYRYLNQSGCIDIPGMDDESNFNKTKVCHVCVLLFVFVCGFVCVFVCDCVCVCFCLCLCLYFLFLFVFVFFVHKHV